MSGERDFAAVVFDYGGVLTGPVHESISGWLTAERLDRESFSGTLREWLSRDAPDGTPIHRLETGELPVESFNEIFAARLRTADGGPVDPDRLLDRMFAGMKLDPAMVELVEALQRNGIRVALLSNSWGNSYPRDWIDRVFDPVVISGEIGMRKPHPAIFEHTLGLLGLPAARVVFVDDAEPNVLGARRSGLTAIQHAGPESTAAALGGLFPGPGLRAPLARSGPILPAV